MPTATIHHRVVHFREAGAAGSGTSSAPGVPIVLLHAFPLQSAMWKAQLAELGSAHRVIAPDLAGFGQSAPLDGPLSTDALAEDLHALLRSLNALPCVLGGLSMGGYVAMAFARRFGGDLKGLMLLNTRMDADGDETRKSRDRNVALVREKGPAAIADTMIPRLLSPGAAAGRPDLVKSVRRMIEATPARSIEQALLALRDRPDSTDVLKTLAVPMLALTGDADQLTPPPLAEAMHRAAGSRSHLVLIPGAGHLSAVEQPAQVSRAIRQFVGRL